MAYQFLMDHSFIESNPQSNWNLPYPSDAVYQGLILFGLSYLIDLSPLLGDFCLIRCYRYHRALYSRY